MQGTHAADCENSTCPANDNRLWPANDNAFFIVAGTPSALIACEPCVKPRESFAAFAGTGRSVTWTAFNMVAQITQGTTTVAFAGACPPAALCADRGNSEHTRIVQTVGGASPSTTTYLNALGASSEKFTAGANVTWRDYIQADGHIVAEKFSGSTSAVRYFVLDHLSSVAVVMDETGAVTERLSYDAWGQRRCANGTGNASCFTASATTRGFTNQEEIDSVGLVNLNARIYDPVLGRFMSADDVVQDVFGPQTLNRYSYVYNNPLSFTDPTGHVGEIETVVVTASGGNPVVAAVTVVADVVLSLFGFGLFGSAAVVPPPINVTNPTPATSPAAGGNPTGLPQVQNTAIPVHNINNVVPASFTTNSDAVTSAAGSYAGASPVDASQILAQTNPVDLNAIEQVVVIGQRVQAIPLGELIIRSVPLIAAWWWAVTHPTPPPNATPNNAGSQSGGNSGGNSGSTQNPASHVKPGGAGTAGTPPGGPNDPDLDPNKLNHVFGNPDHRLDGVVQEQGGEKQAMQAIKSAAKTPAKAQVGANGVFQVTVRVGSYDVTVRGAVANGVVRIGSAWVPGP